MTAASRRHFHLGDSRRRRSRAWLLSTLGLAALGWSTGALAQDTPPAAEDEGDIEEIVVTATGRQQAVQEIPVAVNVVSGDQIVNAGVVDIRGIQQLAPSLKTTTGQSSATGVVLTIRGIGTAGDNPGFEPAVGVFVDGVFRARAGSALSELPPLDRVEVLRGPQGTLFGRNTSAGALNIVTAGPAFDLGGYVDASYGNFDEVEIKAGVTGPVSQQVALRFDGGYHRRDGFITDVNSGNDINNIDRYFLRAQALYDTSDVTFRLIADYAATDERCCGAINTLSGLSLPLDNTNAIIGRIATSSLNPIASTPALNGVPGRIGLPAYERGSRLMAVSPGRSLLEQVDEWGVSGELTWDLGGVAISSITAYRDWEARRGQDIDFSGIDRAYRDGYQTGLSDFTQEVRLRGSAFDDKLDWLVGAFYLNERLFVNDRIQLGAQANQYVDTIINGLTRNPATLPNGLQLHGTLGPTVPLFGQVALASNPALRAQALADPVLFNLFNSPVPGNPSGSGHQSEAYRVNTDAFAVFTHNIIELTDRLSLTLGLRYNYERKTLNANQNAVTPTCDFLQRTDPRGAAYRAALISVAQSATNPLGLFAPAYLLGCNPVINSEFNGVRSDSRTENEFTGTAKLSFKLTDDVLLYGGYDRGYKSGGYNLDRGSYDSVFLGGNGPQATDLEFGNETVNAYEVGVKTTIGQRVRLNATLFYQDFAGYQSNRFLGSNFVVLNYAQFISQGIELESSVRVTPDLNIEAGYTYIDSEVTDPRAGPDDGQQGANTPEHTITGSVTWTPPIADGIDGLAHIDARYQSETFPLNDLAARPFTRNGDFVIVNLRAGVSFNDGKYTVEGYVENLFDTYFNITALPVPEQGSSFANYPSPPRFYGLRVVAKM
ncbi:MULTISPECIES: TonB-dependent receptor [unclassified Sphingomonas]|uniref:TonB-dependent receptor n=1 Tax=unclassified Sphingomonas TaxID=196159 RepID=UPI000A53C35C|nr:MULTISPECIES: TonB-dependent receptor [unclassified Sphingomonas]